MSAFREDAPHLTLAPELYEDIARLRAVELTGDQDPIADVQFGSDYLIGSLDNRMQQLAGVAVEAMVLQLGVPEDDVRLVISPESNGDNKLVLIDASPNGRYVGNYGKIVAAREKDNDWFKLNIDGQLIDPLEATTYPAYWATVAERRRRGLLLPDSVALSHVNDEPWTATMLTGEPLTDEGLIVVGSVSSNAVSTVPFNPDRGGRSMRVRPSIVVAYIDDLSSAE